MINFPTSLDTLTNPNAGDNTSVVSHSLQHQNANDAIEALEAKVGVNSSAVTSSHDYKLSEVTGSDKAVSKTGTQTLTNKTLTAPTINGGTLDSATITSPTVTVGSDAVGDIYTRDTGGSLARIGAGTTGQVLTSNGAGTKPTYQTPSTITKAEVQNQSVIYATAGGTANALTLTLSPAPSAYTAGMKVSFKASATNTGATTINVNGLGVLSIVTGLSRPLLAGDILINQIYEIVYNSTGTVWQLVNPASTKTLKVDPQDNTTSSTTEKTIATFSVPGSTLNTGRAIRIKTLVFQTQASNTGTFTYKLKYGSTTLVTGAIVTSDSANRNFAGFVEAVLYFNVATNAQYGTLGVILAKEGSITSNENSAGFAGSGTSTEDSSVSKTIELTVTSASASYTATAYGSTIELL